jgi:hypothetical protein
LSTENDEDNIIIKKVVKNNIADWNKTINSNTYNSGYFEMPLVHLMSYQNKNN